MSTPLPPIVVSPEVPNHGRERVNRINLFRSLNIMAALGSLAGIGSAISAVTPFSLTFGASKRKRYQHPGTYRGSKRKARKFANLTRQQIRASARKELWPQIAALQLPQEDQPRRRRILRSILRDRVNREWREFGAVRPLKAIVTHYRDANLSEALV